MPVYLFEMKLGYQSVLARATGVQLNFPIDKQDQQQYSNRLFAHTMYAHLNSLPNKNEKKKITNKNPLINLLVNSIFFISFQFIINLVSGV